MNAYQIASLLFGSGVGLLLLKWAWSRIMRVGALERGLQALLRDRLYYLYDKWAVDREYAPDHAKQNWENLYKNYHSLGHTGVMDAYNEEFMALPTKRKEKREDDTNDEKMD